MRNTFTVWGAIRTAVIAVQATLLYKWLGLDNYRTWVIIALTFVAMAFDAIDTFYKLYK